MRVRIAAAAVVAAAAHIASAAAAAAPTPTSNSTLPSPTLHPCAQASALWATQVSTALPTVPAALAHDCLKSVPLGKGAAIEFVDSIVPYLEWQSDAAYKKDPPADYPHPGYDIFGNLANVRAKLVADEYDGEYDFQADLFETVFAPGHDGHFVMYTDLLARAFRWTRQHPLVSISEDGVSLPVIKLLEDVLASPETAPVVEEINCVKASTYIERTIDKAAFVQDPDAAYNTMFFSQGLNAALGSNGFFVEGGGVEFIYPGPKTTFKFDNGTKVTVENKASVVGSLSGVVDGPSFYSKFVYVAPEGVQQESSPQSEPARADYPEPVIATGDGVVSGYYLEGPGLDNVAVISVLAFSGMSPIEFQAVVRDFIAEAKAAGKTKLVVDFQGNGGGYLLLGYDFFRQLFPHIEPDGFSRWKESNGLMALAEISKTAFDFDPYTSDELLRISLSRLSFNYRTDLNLTLGPFETFEDKFSPHVYQDTEYTSLMRLNLTDPLVTSNRTFGLGTTITGYGATQNLTQPFRAEDIVLLYDGFCASTCTVASEMLRLQGKVKSVAFGGRPQEGPMQGVGGVKGSQVLTFGAIQRYAETIGNYTDDPALRAELDRYTDLPIVRSVAGAVNVRDQILRGNVDDGLPAQYVVEEADCRLYWTADMITDVTKVWSAAANAAFNGAKCAYGGIERSSRIFGFTPSRPHAVQPQRLSELVDKTPVTHSQEWVDIHEQKVAF